MIKQLEEFQRAYNELLEEWNKNDILNDLKSIELYPFNKSFEELNINEWIEKSIEELKNPSK